MFQGMLSFFFLSLEIASSTLCCRLVNSFSKGMSKLCSHFKYQKLFFGFYNIGKPRGLSSRQEQNIRKK